jgi:hypothetical protein
MVRHVGQPRLDGDFIARRVQAEDLDLTARRTQQVQQALDRRRLAGAVAAEEAVAAAGLDAKTQAVDGIGAAVPAMRISRRVGCQSERKALRDSV